MSIVKLNNRSVKDITAFGSITSLGSLTHIATQTASSSASLSFTSGIDNTYKEYIFFYVNMHPVTDEANWTFQGSTNSGGAYGVTMTSTKFRSVHLENDSYTTLSYEAAQDLAQSTSFHNLHNGVGNENDECASGYLHLFNPSSTTFVKHFLNRGNQYTGNPGSEDNYSTGYFNTTSAIDAIQFKFSSGNIDSGQILLFGLN